MEQKIKGYMDQLTHDLGCLTFVHVPKEELATHTTFANGILFVPASLTGGGCWSTLGVGGGFVGSANAELIQAGITSLGAPATWQIISLTGPSASSFGCYNERTVQHEGFDLEHSHLLSPFSDTLRIVNLTLKTRKNENSDRIWITEMFKKVCFERE